MCKFSEMVGFVSCHPSNDDVSFLTHASAMDQCLPSVEKHLRDSKRTKID